MLASNGAAFDWIAERAPAGSFYAYDDPAYGNPFFYLYTGRHAVSLPVIPRAFYREDREAVLRPFRDMAAAFAREQHIDYRCSPPRTSIATYPTPSAPPDLGNQS